MYLKGSILVAICTILLGSRSVCNGDYYNSLGINMGDLTLAGAQTLPSGGQVAGPWNVGSLIMCSARCSLNTDGSCSAFSFCEDGACNVLVNATLPSNMSSVQLTSRVGCSVFNKTDPLVLMGGTATTTAVSSTTTMVAPTTTLAITTTFMMEVTTATTATTTRPATTSTNAMSTTAFSTTQAPAAAKTASTVSLGEIFIPTLTLTTFPDTFAQCLSRQSRVIDIANATVLDEVCTALRVDMMLPVDSIVWIHALMLVPNNNNCGADDKSQRLQLVVGSSTCTTQSWIPADLPTGYPLCWRRSAAPYAFTLNNATGTPVNFQTFLAYTMSYASAVQWCSTLSLSPAGKSFTLMKYEELSWQTILQAYVNSNRDTFSCGMDFWIDSMTWPAPQDCTVQSYLRLTIDGYGTFGETPTYSNLCGLTDKYPFCADI